MAAERLRRYAMSRDGKLRCNIRAMMRLDEEEVATLESLAKEAGESLTTYVNHIFSEAFYSAVFRREDEKGYSEEDDCNYT
jgi:hypothetical protein